MTLLAIPMDAFAYETENGVPVWPMAKKIDDRIYVRDSEHMSPTDAKRRVEQIRDQGGYAQAHTVTRPKFGEYDGAWGRPAFAAVYAIPPDKTSHEAVVRDDGSIEWTKPTQAPRKSVDSERIKYGQV